jgi:selenide, water dikinase
MQVANQIKLTTFAKRAGCAAKMGPAALAAMLIPLSDHWDDNLIVGLQTSDDAAVYRISDELAVVQTIDFFTPIVDDPYAFGAIAAANSMSDIYAMGGEVAFALNVVTFPDDLDINVLAEIMRGGADKVKEAGASIAGGHSIIDSEPKYGLSVTGFVHPDRIWRKSGARPGDILFLTKPIGAGVVATALKAGAADVGHVAAAVESMSTLNRQASRIAHDYSPSACTDITGFSLLGHGFEIADKSGVQLTMSASQVPLLPGAVEYARAGHQPGGLGRNRTHYTRAGVRIDPAIDETTAALLFDPQTSGGLLFCIPESSAQAMEAAFAASNAPLWRIGSVETGSGVQVTA